MFICYIRVRVHTYGLSDFDEALVSCCGHAPEGLHEIPMEMGNG